MSVVFSSHRFRDPDTPVSAPVPDDPPELLGQRLIAAGLLSPDDLRRALQRQSGEATRLGDILLAQDMVDQGELVNALAEQSGLTVLERGAARPDIALARSLDKDDCLEFGFLPLKRTNGATAIAICDPQNIGLIRRRLPPELALSELVLVTRTTLMRGIEIVFRSHLAERAEHRTPAGLSCRNWSPGTTGVLLGAVILTIAAGLFFAPKATVLILTVMALVVIFASSTLKALCLVAGQHKPRQGSMPEKLPRVSILVPLFKEAQIASSLVTRLSCLNYPAELLEIIVVAEADDTTTLTALAETEFPPHMRAIVVPRGELKTKPRALNYAMDFTQGEILGIYDAEDAPAPDQIRDVVRAFANGGRNLACVQGVLSYYNWPRNWLSRCFFLEYAAWFRVMLPGLRRMGFAIPLGGTTVFMKRAQLIEMGGWDAHNVTEDADLGIRLARFGYHTDVISSVTEEEANCRLWPWVRQRSRWLKGYAVTWAVHMRHPLRLLRDLGLKRFVGFQVLFLGTLASFFLAPAFWTISVLLISGAATPELLQISRDTYIAVSISFVLAEMLNLALIWKAVDGLSRRPSRLWGLTMPLYFAFASVASYKALLELCRNPFFWDKTEHGHLGGMVDDDPEAPASSLIVEPSSVDPKSRLERHRQMVAQRL